MLHTAWFIVIVLMLSVYAVLDGFDLGVGALHLLLPRTDEERGVAIESIGPVWNGNEVWLIAAGGAMFAAFPLLYASAFSGFYLPLMLVVWLLAFRGLSIEFRHQIDHPMWRRAWDVAFSLSSALLAVVLGVAFGNVLRGVPLDAGGRFEGTFSLVLNPFSLVGGALSLATLSMHGACYLALKTTGALHARSRAWAGALWWGVVAALAVTIAASVRVRPDFAANFSRWPALALLPLLTFASLAVVRLSSAPGHDARRFVASAAAICGLLGSAAAGLYPRLLPTFYGSTFAGLDIYNAAAPDASLGTALTLFLVGLTCVAAYMGRSYSAWAGRIGKPNH